MSLTATSQVLEPELSAPDADDDFEGLMEDLDQLEDAPLADDNLPTIAPLEDPFMGAHPPETPGFFAPGPLATSIFQDMQLPYSPELPQGDMAGVLRVQQSPEAPSSANKSLMHDEMRHEEDLSTSPLPLNDRPLARISLGTSVPTTETQEAGKGFDENIMEVNEDAAPRANLDDSLPSAKVSHEVRPSLTTQLTWRFAVVEL